MNPNIGKRAGIYQKTTVKKPSAARDFIELNTHKNIVLKRDFMYLEDVKTAININTLDERIRLRKWLKMRLQSSASKSEIVSLLEDLIDKDRHRLQKRFKISI